MIPWKAFHEMAFEMWQKFMNVRLPQKERWPLRKKQQHWQGHGARGECEVSELLGVAGAEWAWGVIGRELCLISNGTSLSPEDGVTGKRLT